MRMSWLRRLILVVAAAVVHPAAVAPSSPSMARRPRCWVWPRPAPAQTILGWGAGLGPINELGQVFPLIQKYAQTDFDNVRLNFMRLIWSGDGGTLGRAYKPVLEWIKTRMASYGEELWVHATGYGYKPGDPINLGRPAGSEYQSWRRRWMSDT